MATALLDAVTAAALDAAQGGRKRAGLPALTDDGLDTPEVDFACRYRLLKFRGVHVQGRRPRPIVRQLRGRPGRVRASSARWERVAGA